MKATELVTKSADELNKELNDLLKAQFGLRMQKATQRLTNHSQIKKSTSRYRACPYSDQTEGGRQMSESVQQKVKVQRTLVGRVVSDKMTKTVTVLVERKVKHPVIGKIMTRSSKYHAHAETNEYKEGDLVEIAECRPISKTKAWTVTRLLEKSRGV